MEIKLSQTVVPSTKVWNSTTARSKKIKLQIPNHKGKSRKNVVSVPKLRVSKTNRIKKLNFKISMIKINKNEKKNK